MTSRDQPGDTCRECGALLAPGLRYCVECYSPVAAGATHAHVEMARNTTTTHRTDPTIVFSPEKHDQLVRRTRRRKRLIGFIGIALALIVTGVIALRLIDSHRREVEKVMAREKAAERDLDLLSEALERFRNDVGRYPTNAEGLTTLARRPAAFPPDDSAQSNYWFGPYLEHVPEVDPWGNDYLYRTADGGRSFELTSDGPLGETGSGSAFRVTSQASPTSYQ